MIDVKAWRASIMRKVYDNNDIGEVKRARDECRHDRLRFLDEIEKLQGVVKQLRGALPGIEVPARNGHPKWPLSKVSAVYPDPEINGDYVSQIIDAEVIIRALKAADEAMNEEG